MYLLVENKIGEKHLCIKGFVNCRFNFSLSTIHNNNDKFVVISLNICDISLNICCYYRIPPK